MDHFNLNDELRQKLMESAGWQKAGVELIQEADSDCEDDAPKGKGKKKEAKKKEDDQVKDAQVEEEVDVDEYEDDEEDMYEEVHVCPLCVSQLDDPIDEERIYEHLNVVIGMVDRLTQMNEGDEDVEAVIAETVREILLQDDEE